MKLKTLSSILLSTTIAHTAMAAEVITKDPADMNWTGSVGLTFSTLDTDVANEAAVGEQMSSLELAFNYSEANFVVGGGFGLLIFDDQSDESYYVETSSGDIEDRDADANGFNFFFEGGYRHNIGQFNLDLVGGVQGISAERSVSNCTDCPTAELEIDGGTYIKPRVSYSYSPTGVLELGYAQYLSGDIQSTLALTWGGRF